MDETKVENTQQSWHRWTVIATVVTAFATVVIAYVYGSQIRIMQHTLDVLKESNRVAQMPMLKPNLHPDPEKASRVAYEKTEEGGERWILPYWVINTGTCPATNLIYYHALSCQDSIPTPSADKFVRRFSNDVVFPGAVYSCGWDPILRQQVLDSLKAGKKYYRHLYLEYSDEFKNLYRWHTIWELSDYTEGQPLDFSLFSNRRAVVAR